MTQVFVCRGLLVTVKDNLGKTGGNVMMVYRCFFDSFSTVSKFKDLRAHKPEFCCRPGPMNMKEIDFQKPFYVADWLVDPVSCRIKNTKQEVKLEPKSMLVLVCLAQQAGEVVIRENLEKMVWQDVVVGYDSLASSIIKLRKALGDDSKQPRYIETVPKRGYRFIAEVSQSQTDTHPIARNSEITSSATAVDIKKAGSSSRQRNILLLASIIILLSGLVIINFTDSKQPAEQNNPSIAVLPFINLSNDQTQDYFSDGLTADLITDLSKISSLNVISRNSVFTYKNTDVDMQQLHKDIGVTYVLEGSVRKDGNKVRISARLINAQNNFTIWADRFDGSLTDIFKLQDIVSHKVVSSLAISLTEQERNVLNQDYTDNVAAYDEFLHGWQLFWVLSKETNQQARSHFLKAIELDNRFARAYSNLAYTYVYDRINGWQEDQHSLQHARDYAMKGLALDSQLPQAHWVVSLVHLFSKEYQLALTAVEQNIKLDPNNADGYGMKATILNYSGQPKKALELMKKAMSLNPYYPQLYYVIRGEIYYNLHQYKQAIQDFEAALNRNPEAQEPRLWLAAAYAQNGDLDDASWLLETIRYDDIKISSNYLENVVPINDPVQMHHFLDGLIKAGLEMNK